MVEGLIRDKRTVVIKVKALTKGAGATTISTSLAISLAKALKGNLITYIGEEEEINSWPFLMFRKRKAGMLIHLDVNWESRDNLSGNFIVVDKDLDCEADLTIYVLEALPSRIYAIKDVPKEGVLVLNKMNKAIGRREISRVLGRKIDYVLGTVNREEMCKAELKSKHFIELYSFEGLDEIVENIFRQFA